MGRMIDTDAAYAVLTDYYHHSTETQHEALREALGRVETVDAVPVVRCKDCIHYQFASNRAFGFPVKQCKWTGFEDIDDYDFCSSGRRKDGDHAEGTIQEEQS